MPLPHQKAFTLSRDIIEPFWRELRGSNIFLAGGTGFFGTSLLEGMYWAKKHLGIDFEVTVLTRDDRSFLERHPCFSDEPWIKFIRGDATELSSSVGTFSHVIHGASAVALPGQNQNPEVEAKLTQGTSRLLTLASQSGASRFLYVSSGAVYGAHPQKGCSYGEDLQPSPTTTYGKGKYQSELLCVKATQSSPLEVVIARGFAFVGPYLPLDSHFAIGNFIKSSLDGTPITIGGDGTALRSYLHSADLVNSLVALLVKGRSGEAYNVGSDQPISIRELAEMVSTTVHPGLEVRVLKTAPIGQAPDRYIPSVDKIKNELGMSQRLDLRAAIELTAQYHRSLKN